MKPFDQDAEELRAQLEEGGDHDSDGPGEEAVRPVVRDISREPTQKEVEEHYMHHADFRQWCPHCVKGKAVSFGSRKRTDGEEEAVPMISVDYMFMADRQVKEEERGMPILVLKDRRSKLTWARVVPAKGVNAYAIKQTAKMITLLGYTKIIFKSDGEPAIKALKEAIKNELAIEVIMEESPVGDHAANGDVESAVRQVQGQIRTMKDALESRCGQRLPRDSHALPWLVAHAAATIARFRKDAHGITAYRRWKGKEFRRPVAEFGENIWYLKSDSVGKDKYVNRWHEGVWLGVSDETGESIIGTSEGAVKAKDFRRKPVVKERWDKEKLLTIRGVPWKTSVHAEGDELNIQINIPKDDEPLSELVKTRDMSDPIVKRFRISPGDVKKHGYTVGCAGCRCLSRGQPPQNHSELCRKRLAEILQKDGDVRLDRERERMDGNAARRKTMEKQADDMLVAHPRQNMQQQEAQKKRKAEAEADDAERMSRDMGKQRTEKTEGAGDQKDESRQQGGARSSGVKRRADDAQEDELMTSRIRRKLDEAREDDMQISTVFETMQNEAIQEHYDIEARGADTVVAYEREYYDNLNGERLDPELVRKARAEEMREFANYGVYRKVPLSECYDRTGKEPIGVRWVDVNKGDRTSPEYRSRLVAQEIKRDKRLDLFAGMPPLEAKRVLFSLMMSSDEQEGVVLDFIDVKRAYLQAGAIRDVYVQLPEEDREQGMCGKLLKAMYGTRDAAQCWEREYVGFMKRLGFATGRSSRCIFWHAERGIRAVIHGDDFTLFGRRDELDWFRTEMLKTFAIKVKARIGPGDTSEQATRILNRIVEYSDNVLMYEADQRHAEIVIEGMRLTEESKTVVTPGMNGPTQPGKTTLSDSQYRMLAARCNYLSQDRPDIQYATKEVCRKMSAPDEAAWGKLKRIARYLKGEKRVCYQYCRQQLPNEVVVYSDTDYAGCKETRKSTSGGAIMIGGHCVRTWSSTQAKITLSSGEAEYNGIVKAISEGIGVQNILRDMGYDFKLSVRTDSSAAIGICSRYGSGSIKHMDIKRLGAGEDQ